MSYAKDTRWQDLARGGIIPEAATSLAYETGGWRTFRPIRDRMLHRLPLLLGLLPRQRDPLQGAVGEGPADRPGPLQGLRGLRRGLPEGLHQDGPGDGDPEVATATASLLGGEACLGGQEWRSR